MYLVINGGGKVGSCLGGILAARGHTVVIIEKEGHVLEKLADELSTDILLIHGDGCRVSCQQAAGIEHADIFVAVTGSDQDNLVACQIAKSVFQVKRALSRVNSPKNESVFYALGIEAVSATTFIANLIGKEMTIDEVFTHEIIKRGRLALLEINLAADHCAVMGKKIAELVLPPKTVFVSIIRGEEILIPRGDTVLHGEDRIIALTSLENESSLRRVLTGEQ